MNFKTQWGLFFIYLMIASNAYAGGQAEKLTLLWETTGFNNPESVVYDASNDVLFVSNVNGGATDKDGDGYIAKMRTDGTIIEQHWVDGLHAPKGMTLYADMLYVADIDTLIAIHIPSATIYKTYPVIDAVFLNDVVANDAGEIFVSDMLLNRIHRLSNDQFEIWLESPQLENPNGLYVNGDQLILGAWGVMQPDGGFATEVPGHLKSISLQDRSIISLGGTPIGNLDGVEAITQDSYYVTDWMAGKLFHINHQGEAELLLELEQGMADLEVLVEQKLVILPMMNSDKVLAYKVVEGAE